MTSPARPTIITSNGNSNFYAPVKTGAEITVELRFKARSDTGVGAAQITTAKANLEKGVNTYWNNRYTIEANDSMCGKKSFKVKFKIVWADLGAALYHQSPRHLRPGKA